jgi:peptidoglycan L-alanyl-D-glutamate endopeptidase CwlK
VTITLGARSLTRLEGVHPDLVRVVKRAAALSSLDFTVLEGLRTLERQKELFAKRATTTMKSRHLTGHAVDLAPMIGGEVRWDWPLYHQLEPIVKQAAAEEGVSIEWGGDWRTFKDGPHWQLPWADYP